MPDRYTYPGTEILRNKRGITDPSLLRAVETTLTLQRMAALERSPIEGDFDLEHLRAIHRFLLSPLYDFAGEIRTTDTGPGGTAIAHCRPEFILQKPTGSSPSCAMQTTYGTWTRQRSQRASPRPGAMLLVQGTYRPET